MQVDNDDFVRSVKDHKQPPVPTFTASLLEWQARWRAGHAESAPPAGRRKPLGRVPSAARRLTRIRATAWSVVHFSGA